MLEALAATPLTQAEAIRSRAGRGSMPAFAGNPPLGYDVKDRKLVVNVEEAAVVRMIFERFTTCGSATALARTLRDRLGQNDPKRGLSCSEPRLSSSVHHSFEYTAKFVAVNVLLNPKVTCPHERYRSLS